MCDIVFLLLLPLCAQEVSSSQALEVLSSTTTHVISISDMDMQCLDRAWDTILHHEGVATAKNGRSQWAIRGDFYDIRPGTSLHDLSRGLMLDFSAIAPTNLTPLMAGFVINHPSRRVRAKGRALFSYFRYHGRDPDLALQQTVVYVLCAGITDKTSYKRIWTRGEVQYSDFASLANFRTFVVRDEFPTKVRAYKFGSSN